MALQAELVGDSNRQAFAYETITVSTTALPLTAATYTPSDSSSKGKAQRAVVTANDQPARFTYNGTTPTATVGHKLGVGETLVITGFVNIAAFRIIREGATDVNLAVTYER
jgi:hypothetical protein